MQLQAYHIENAVASSSPDSVRAGSPAEFITNSKAAEREHLESEGQKKWPGPARDSALKDYFFLIFLWFVSFHQGKEMNGTVLPNLVNLLSNIFITSGPARPKRAWYSHQFMAPSFAHNTHETATATRMSLAK